MPSTALVSCMHWRDAGEIGNGGRGQATSEEVTTVGNLKEGSLRSNIYRGKVLGFS